MTRRFALTAVALVLSGALSGCVISFKPERIPEPNARAVNAEVARLLDHTEQYGNETRLVAR